MRSILGSLVTVAFTALALVAPATAQTAVGARIQITPHPATTQGKPAIVHDGRNFFVVWRDARDPVGHRVYGARVSAAGVARDPDGIAISAVIPSGCAPDNHCLPSVGFDGTNYLVVWTAPSAETGVNELYGARVTRSGTVLDPGGVRITTNASAWRMPSIAFDGTRYLVVWRTPSLEIRGLRVSTAAAAVDAPAGFVIGTGRYPYVAYDGTNFMVVWHSGVDGVPTLDIVGARVSTAGAVLGSFPIATGAGDQNHSSISYGDGRYLVAWNDTRLVDANNGTAWAARVGLDGTVVDRVRLGYARGQVSVVSAFDGDRFLAVWQADQAGFDFRQTDVFGRAIPVTGGIPSTRVTVAASYGHQFGPVIGFGGDRLLVAWTESLSSGRCNDGCLYAQLLARTPAADVVAGDEPSRAPEVEAPGWVSEQLGDGSALYAISGRGRSVYAVGEGGGAADVPLYRFDGGAWSVVTTLPNARKFGLFALGADDVWAGGWCADVVQWDGAAAHQSNCLDFPTGTFPIATGLWGSSDRNLFAVGAEGEIWHYDGGPGSVRSSWLRQTSGVAVDLWDVWGFAGGPVHAVGEHGTILRYDGAAWQRMTSPTPHGLNAVWGSGPNDVWAVGDFGTIVRWNGATWQAVPSPTREHLFGVYSCNAGLAVAVGAHGTALRWTGTAWLREITGTTANLHDVWASAGTVWAVGSNGHVLRRLLPDCIANLAVIGVRKPPSTAQPGGTFTVADTVRNRGTAPADPSRTRYYLSTDQVKSAGDVPLMGTRSVPALAPGASSTGQATARVKPDMPPGTYYVIACADAARVVDESSQADNCRASSSTVTIAP